MCGRELFSSCKPSHESYFIEQRPIPSNSQERRRTRAIGPAKQEASHNYCAALFDRLEVGAVRGSVECARVERWLLGEELKNIGACDGAERRERHKRLDRWATRMEGASFGRILLSYYALLQARRAAQGLGCDGFKVREEKGTFFLCWQDRALFSVSAWRGRRFDWPPADRPSGFGRGLHNA
ncbi:SCARECROW-like [Hordeum vulgare]|nr:SCARECROW-like [Hordeum vulgare]